MSRSQPGPSELCGRILEIGDGNLFLHGLPEATDVLFCSFRGDARNGRPWLTLRAFVRALRAARRGEYALIALHPPSHAAWHWRSFLFAFKHSLMKGRFADLVPTLVSPFLFELTRLLPGGRIIAIARSDDFTVPPNQHFLLDKAEVFYKRELPIDLWQVFHGLGHRRLPGRAFRLSRRWRGRLAKLRPIGIGISDATVAEASAAWPAQKRTDVFFAGTIDGNSSVRADIPRMIEALRSAGVNVDTPDRPLPHAEFMRRCAQAWITLSPEGLGWDCYRHLESALAGSVPLVSAPTIQRYKPMIVGTHCFAWYPDEDRIVAIVQEALADKPGLERMAAAARQHVLDHLTERAMCLALAREHGVLAPARGDAATPPPAAVPPRADRPTQAG